MKNLIAEEKMEQMLKSIEVGIMEVSNSEKFKDYLKFQSKNYSHSVKNTLLANQQYFQQQIDKGLQPPLQTVGLFKGQEQWEELERNIKPGEIPLEIFQPILKKKLERNKDVPYINYKSLKVGSNLTLNVVLRDVIYSGKGLYVYMLELVSLSGKEVQGILRATSKTPLEFKMIYNIKGAIEQFRSIKQLAIKEVVSKKDLYMKEISYCAGFKLAPVFSEHQTYGKDIPNICERLEGQSEQAKALEEVMKQVIDIPITYEPSDSNGYYVPSKKIININKQLLEEKYVCQRVKTLIHEYAHYLVDTTNCGEKIDEIALTHNGERYALEELVAESVAFMVCEMHGIDTSSYSFEYLACWSCTNVKVLKSVFDIIQRIYAKVIKEIIKVNDLD
ncbi:MAG: zincin-like metallopeptidase domain-containing protein, partial [Clostridium sp.]